MPIRIGTRGSRLALAQAAEVASLLDEETEIVPIVTAGDRGASPAGSPFGVKGLFVAEITEALVRGDVDLAVHSAKDLPSEDPDGVEVVAVPERGVPYDVLVGREDMVPPDARVGTSSLRRQAQLIRMRPGARIESLRGNVDTRMRRLAEGKVDALVVAGAGLARLGIAPEHVTPIPVDEMVPAPGQGALAVQARSGGEVAAVAAGIDHHPSRLCFEAERELVRRLGGGCRLPLGAYAEWRDDAVRLLAVVLRPDGSDVVWSQIEAPTPARAAEEASAILEAGGAVEILREVQG